MLWVFDGQPKLDLGELLLGKSSVPPLAHVSCGDNADRQLLSPSVNVMLVACGTRATQPRKPRRVHRRKPGRPQTAQQQAVFGPWTVTGTEPFADVKTEKGKATLRFEPKSLAPGEERVVAVSLWREAKPDEVPRSIQQALALRRRRAILEIPRPALRPHQVPDHGIQDLVEASLRGIYQNRDYKNGMPVYQVGPTCYRDVSCADGMFFCEVGMLLGPRKPSDSLDLLLSSQCANGRLWMYWDYWKENGLVLGGSCVTRSSPATLPGWRNAGPTSRAWSASSRSCGGVPNSRPGRAQLRPHARWLRRRGHRRYAPNTAMSSGTWWAAGRRRRGQDAGERRASGRLAAGSRRHGELFPQGGANATNAETKHGNLYLPNVMGSDGHIAAAAGQWAFLQSIFPGKLYERDDPLVQGSLAMLEAAQVEGLPLGRRLGRRRGLALFQPLAGQRMALGRPRAKNRRPSCTPSPTMRPRAGLVGRANVQRQRRGMLRRHAAQLGFRRVHPPGAVHARDRARKELHLVRGASLAWTRPGMVTRMKGVLTEFGPVSFVLEASADGKQAILKLDVPQRIRPAKVVLHLDGWSGSSGTIELPTKGHVERQIELKTD